MSIGPKGGGGRSGPNDKKYGSGPSPDGGKSNGGRGNNQNGGGGKLRYGAFGGYKGVKRSKAERFVGADIRRLKRDTRNDVRQERRQFRRERGDIKHVYRASGQQLHNLKQNSKAAYGTAAAQSQAAQQALQAQLGSQSGAVQGGANAELARLGLGGSDATAQMGADAANAQHMAAQSGADNLANLGLAGANSAALSNLMIGSNKGQRLSDLGQARNIRDENVSHLRDALHEAQAGRGDSVRALLDQMAQTGWSQHMQQAQMQLQREAMKKNQYYGGSGYGSSYSSGGYSPSNYQSNYGYGYSAGQGYSGSPSGGSANAAKSQLYQNLMNVQP